LMPYSLFHKLHLGPLQSAPFSLQLVYGSETHPLGKLEDVSVKLGDIRVLEDFFIANMNEADDAQIILSRPFQVIAGFHIDVKRGWITFEVQGSYAMFCNMKEKVFSPHSSLLDAFPFSPEIDMEHVLIW